MVQQLSKAHQKQEEANEQAAVVQEAEEKKANTNVYWVRASKFQIGGFVKEIKNGGQIIQPEASLTIFGNVLATDDKETIAFIESTDAIKKGRIIKCKDIEEAHGRTRALRLEKGVKKFENEDVSFTQID